MSVKEEFVVKEEYMFEESDVGFNHISQADKIRTKCGEVFLDQQGDFNFVCALCLHNLPDLPSFREHIRKCYPIIKVEPFKPDTPLLDLTTIKSEPPDETETIVELPHYEDEEDVELPAADIENSGKDSDAKLAKQKRSKRKTYCCLSCGKLVFAFSLYRNHYHAEHPDMIERDLTPTGSRNQTLFSPKVPDEMLCVYCLKTFVDPVAYKAHMISAHPGRTRYLCRHCPKAFAHRSARDYHVDVHEGNRRFECPHCLKAFSYPKNLQCHINNTHLNIKFACRFCGLEFTQKSSVNVHERTHTNEKPYQCDECDKTFAAKARLTNHKKRHTKIRDYKCSQCEWAFYTSSHLNAHIVAMHSPLSCDICGQTFKVKGALRSHKLLHFDEVK